MAAIHMTANTTALGHAIRLLCSQPAAATRTIAIGSISIIDGRVSADTPIYPSLLVAGAAMLLVGFGFKVATAPFHVWTPDVYEGAPTPVTAFLSTAPKAAAMALLLRVMVAPFGHLLPQWQNLIILVSIASMLLGALGWNHYDRGVEVVTPFFPSSGTGQINAVFPVSPVPKALDDIGRLRSPVPASRL